MITFEVKWAPQTGPSFESETNAGLLSLAVLENFDAAKKECEVNKIRTESQGYKIARIVFYYSDTVNCPTNEFASPIAGSDTQNEILISGRITHFRGVTENNLLAGFGLRLANNLVEPTFGLKRLTDYLPGPYTREGVPS